MKRLLAARKKNFRMLLADALFWGLGFALASPATILPAFAVLLIQRKPELAGYQNILGTLIFSIFTFGMTIPPVFGALWTRGRRRVLPVVIWMVLSQRFSWLVLAAGIWIWGEGSPGLVLVLLIATLAWYSFFSGAVMPPWLELYARIVPSSQRGKVTGLRHSLVGIGGITCLAFTPWLMGSVPFPLNYAVLFTASSTAFTLSTLVIFRLREIFPQKPQARLTFSAYVKELISVPRRDPGFRAYLVQQFFASFRMIGNPALATLKLSSFGLNDGDFAAWSFRYALLLSLSSLAMGPLWGRLADYWGHRRIQGLGVLCAGLGTLAAAFAWNPESLALFFVLFGAANAGMMVSVENMTLDMAPSHERPSYVSLRLLAGTPGLFVPLVGGWMADHGGYTLPLCLAAGVSVLAVIHLWTKVPDPRKRASIGAHSV